jgi:hypothetical protein
MVRKLRYVSPAILTDLIELLKDEDVTLVYAASRLLGTIARHEKTGNADRESISRALSSALRGRSTRHIDVIPSALLPKSRSGSWAGVK